MFSKIIRSVVKVEFNKEWLKPMSIAKLTPKEFLKKKVLEQFPGVTVIDDKLNLVVFETTPDVAEGDAIARAIEQIMSEQYLLPADTMLTCNVVSFYDMDDEDATGEEHDDDSDDPDDDREPRRKVMTFGKKSKKDPENTDRAPADSSDSGEQAEEQEVWPPVRVQKILEEMDNLPGAKEFKALIREIVDLAPVLKKSGNEDIFRYQSYLFSINEGCGIEAYVKLFADIASELGLAEISNRRGISYLKPSESGTGKEVFSDLLASVSRLGSDGV